MMFLLLAVLPAVSASSPSLRLLSSPATSEPPPGPPSGGQLLSPLHGAGVCPPR